MAIVNQAFARKFNLGDHVGRHPHEHRPRRQALDIEIVGPGAGREVQRGEGRHRRRSSSGRIARTSDVGSIGVLRQHAPATPTAMLAAVQAAVPALDPNLPIENPKTMAQQVRENVFLDRMISTLSAGFAVLATLLAAIGPLRRAGLHRDRSGRASSACAWRSAPTARPCAAWCSARSARMTAVGGAVGLRGRGRPRPAGAVAAVRAARATTRWCLRRQRRRC